VAYKHNLPIPVVILVLVVLGLGALVFLHRPPEEDQIRQAVDRYAATLGTVQQLEIHGNVADIIHGDKGTLVYAEFEKKDGTWTFARNLALEWSRAVNDPETQKVVLRHLGERVSQRLQTSVSFKEGITFDSRLGRSPEGLLLGQMDVNFAYPKVGDQQRGGKYTEFFEWKEGRWQSLGAGSLFDSLPRR